MSTHPTPLKTADHGGRADLSRIVNLIEPELEAVNETILDRLSSDIALINQLGAYIVQSGGKRLRPVTVLLSAGTCAHKGDAHVTLAAIVEFIHTATLLHDDVVDASDMRRGKPTANEVWGNQASVLVGDFLYSRSFEMMVELGSMRVMEVMAKTTNRIAEGEVMQLINAHSPDTTEQQYLETIRRKTAKLFESASQLGAVISGQSSSVEQALASYGLHLGTAFQLIDDVLDFSADSDELGKNIGDDLAEGKPTLPIINAMHRGTDGQQELLREAVETGGLKHLDEVMAAIESTGSLAYTARLAGEEAKLAQQALAIVPESPYKEALHDLATFAVERNF